MANYVRHMTPAADVRGWEGDSYDGYESILNLRQQIAFRQRARDFLSCDDDFIWPHLRNLLSSSQRSGG